MVRRGTRWRGFVGLVLIAVPVVAHPRSNAPRPSRQSDLAQYVNPFAGTDAGQLNFGLGGASGNTFPGATLPFGMVQWSPDTSPSRPDHAGGYTYGDTVIRGFSLTHLSGTGCPIYQDVPFMPMIGPVTISPASASPARRTRYATTFSHVDERAAPGYYSVRLDSGVTVALSVTRRTGMGVFAYPATRTATLLINNGGSANGNSQVRITIAGADEVAGSASSGGFCGTASPYTVYFAARFNRPFHDYDYGAWDATAVVPG